MGFSKYLSFALVVLTSTVTTPAFADITNTTTNATFSDLSSAYAAANNGEKLVFDDGTYQIHSFDLDKEVDLYAENAGDVIIDGQDETYIFKLIASFEINGIHFRNADRALYNRDANHEDGAGDIQVYVNNAIFSDFSEAAIYQDNGHDGVKGDFYIDTAIFYDVARVLWVNDGGYKSLTKVLINGVEHQGIRIEGSNEGSLLDQYYTDSTLTNIGSVTLTNEITDTANLPDFIKNRLVLLSVSGNDNEIENNATTTTGSNLTDFGSIHVSGSEANSYKIENNGFLTQLDLTASNGDYVRLSGSNADQFSALPQPTDPAEIATQASTSFGITYSPSAVGSHEATVLIESNDANNSPFQFKITGTSTNNNPVVEDYTKSTDEDSDLSVDVLTSATDADNDTLSISASSLVSGEGQVSHSGNNVTFDPADDYFGDAEISFEVSDGYGTDTGSIDVTVNSVNDAPVVSNETETIDEDNSVTVDVLANDTDVANESQTLTVQSASVTSGQGVYTINEDDTITFDPVENYNGSAVVEYVVSDSVDTTTGQIDITINAVNDAPVAQPITETIQEDATLVSDITSSVSDVEGDTLSISATSLSNASGSVSVDGLSITYTPTENYFGSETLTYTVSDGQATDQSTISITVSSVNDLPSVANDTDSTNEDTSVTVDVLSNDTDVANESQTLSVTSASISSGEGSVVVNQDNTLTFTPADNVHGTSVVTYVVSDGEGTASGTLTITINSVNDTPVVTDESSLVLAGNSVTKDVVENDTDVDADTLSLKSYSLSQGAAGSLSADGNSLTYTSIPGEDATVTVSYVVTDSTEDVSGSWVITVTDTNNDPVANNDTASTNEDTAVTIDALANDTDPDAGNTLTITAASMADDSQGTVSIESNQLLFTPAANINGSVTIHYTISDSLRTDTATVTVTVVAVNDAPVAVDDTASTAEDTAVTTNVVSNDTDTENDSLSIASASVDSEQGSVTFSGGEVTFTPAENFNGQASISYQVSDGTATDDGSLVVTVSAVNDAPTVTDDTASTNEDNQLTSSTSILTNDSDIEGDELSVVAETKTTSQGGSITITSDGHYIYTPADDFEGSDTVSLTVTDGDLSSTSTLTITVSGQNDAPVAVADSAQTNEDTAVTIDVLANDTDVENSELSITEATVSSGNGSVSIDSNQLTFTPNTNENGSATINYTISDGTDTDSATVTVTITAVNDAPVATDDSQTTNEDTAVTIDVLANDTDVTNENQNLSVTSAEILNNGAGSVTVNEDDTLTFSPDNNQTGTISISYTISDGVDSDTATVELTINAVNDAPVANADTAETNEDTVVTIDVLSNDTDVENSELSITKATVEDAVGSVEVDSGTLIFTPVENMNGQAVVNYTISDGEATASASVSVTVLPVQDSPTAVNDSVEVDEDANQTTISVLENDVDVDGDQLTISKVSLNANLILNESTGVFYYDFDSAYQAAHDGSKLVLSDGVYQIHNYDLTKAVDIYAANAGNVTIDGEGEAHIFALYASFEINGIHFTNAQSGIYNRDANHSHDAGDIQVDLNNVIFSDITSAAIYQDNGYDGVRGDIYVDTAVFYDVNQVISVNDGGYKSLTNVLFDNVSEVSNIVGSNEGALIDQYFSSAPLTYSGPLTLNNEVTDTANLPNFIKNTINQTDRLNTSFDDLILASATVKNETTDITYDSFDEAYSAAQAGEKLLLSDGIYQINNYGLTKAVDIYAINPGQVTIDGEGEAHIFALYASFEINGVHFTNAQSGIYNRDANHTHSAGDIEVNLNNVVFSNITNAAIHQDNGYDGFRGEVYVNTAAFYDVNKVVSIDDGGYKSLTKVYFDNVTEASSIRGSNEGALIDQYYSKAPLTTTETLTVSNEISEMVSLPSFIKRQLLAANRLEHLEGELSHDDSNVYFTPGEGVSGVVMIDYEMSDQNTDAVSAKVTATVNPVQEQPVAIADSITIEEGGRVDFRPLANDFDPDGDKITISAATRSESATGTFGFSDDVISYYPSENLNGTFVIDYTISDGALTASSTLTVNITPVEDSPVAVADSITIDEDGKVDFRPLENDSDADGDTIKIISATRPDAATGSFGFSDDVISYYPSENLNGTFVIDYTISDGELESSSTLTVIVSAVQDRPTPVEDSVEMDEDTSIVISPLTNDYDVDGDNLRVTGAVFLSGSGDLSRDEQNIYFTPEANFSGTVEIEYGLNDYVTESSEGKVTVTVNPVQDRPTAVEDFVEMDEDTSIVISPMANDFDVDGDDLRVTGAVFLSGSGELSRDEQNIYFTPNANFNGTVEIEYGLNDYVTESSEGKVTVTVKPVNDTSVLVNETGLSTMQGNEIVIDALANDSDVDGDSLSIFATELRSGRGSIERIESNTKIRFTPDADFVGEAVIRYFVTDGNDDGNNYAEATITVEDKPVYLGDFENVSNLSPITKFLTWIPVSVTNDSESLIKEDGNTEYALTGNASIEIPAFGQSVKLGNGEVLVYTKSEGEDVAINSIFLKYQLREFVTGLIGDFVPQNELDEVLSKLTNTTLVIAYSDINLDGETIKNMPQPVQSFFDGVLSPEFGIPIFNDKGSLNFLTSVKFDDLPSYVTDPFRSLGINQSFIENELGIDGSIIASASVGNVGMILDTISLMFFPDVALSGSAKFEIPNAELGLVLPSLSMPSWMETAISPVSKALQFELDPSVQNRTYLNISADMTDLKSGFGGTIGFESALRINMPNVINRESLRDDPGQQKLDVRSNLEIGAGLALEGEGDVQGTLFLNNDWKYPLGIPNLQVGQGAVTFKVAANVRGADLSAGVNVEFGIGGKGYCLDNDENIMAGGEIAMYLGGRLGASGVSIVSLPISALGISMEREPMTMVDGIRCGTRISTGIALGMADEIIAATPSQQVQDSLRQLRDSYAGNLNAALDTLIEKPLEFAPVSILMDQLRLKKTQFYFATPGVALPGHFDDGTGMKVSGGAEYRTSRHSDDWQSIGNLMLSGTLAGGIQGQLDLLDLKIGEVIELNNPQAKLNITLLPPVAEFELDGSQKVFEFTTNSKVKISSKDGIDVDSTTQVGGLGSMWLKAKSTDLNAVTYVTGEWDLKGELGFDMDLNNVSNQIYGAYSSINSGLDNEYRKALDTLSSEGNEERWLKNKISDVETKIENKRQSIRQTLEPAFNYARSKLNDLYSSASSHRSSARWHLNKRDWYWDSGRGHWWCPTDSDWKWQGKCWDHHNNSRNWHNGVAWGIERGIPAARSVVNIAADKLDTALRDISRTLDPELNAYRLSLVTVQAAKSTASLTVRGLQAANNFMGDVAAGIRDANSITVHNASAWLLSYKGFLQGTSPVSMDFDAELSSVGLRCKNKFDMYLYDPVSSFNNIIEGTFNGCIADRKNAETTRSASQQIVALDELGVSTRVARPRIETGNDDIAQALDLGTTESVSINGDNSNATSSESEYNQVLQKSSVWYQWQPESSGLYQIRADGDDTAISVHLADAENAGSQDSLVIADVRPVANGNIIYSFDQNTRYLIGVSTQIGEPGIFSLSIDKVGNIVTPENDDFENAQVLTGLSGSTLGSNIGASTQSGETVADGLGQNNSVWYQYTASDAGVYSFNSNGSGFDTVIRAFSSDDSSLANSQLLKTADDLGLDPTGSLSIRLNENQKVWINVSSKFGAVGDVKLAWRYIELSAESWLGDDFNQAVVLGGESLTISNLGASSEANEPLHAGITKDASIWTTFVPDSSHSYIVDTSGSSIDTVLAVYQGDSLAGLTEIASNDNSLDQTSRVKVDLESGQSYLIAVASKLGSEGDIQLNYQLNDLNDDLAEKSELLDRAGEFKADLTDASLETSEPDYESILASNEDPDVLFGSLSEVLNSVSEDGAGSENDSGAPEAPQIDIDGLKELAQTLYDDTLQGLQDNPITKSLWWAYTPDATGQLSIQTDAEDNLDTAIFVFDEQMTAIAFNDNSDNKLTSRVNVDLEKDQTYFISIASRGQGKASVSYVLTTEEQQVVSNDKPSSAISIRVDGVNGEPVYVSGENLFAKGNDNEQDQLSKLISSQSDKRLWWQFNMADKGTLVLDTEGSSVDTVIEVYERASNGKLYLVAINERYDIEKNTSKVRFTVEAERDYLVAVDSLGGVDGELRLGYQFSTETNALPSNDLFGNAQLLSGNELTLDINNRFASYQTGEPKNLSFLEYANITWYEWQADDSGEFSISVEAEEGVDPVIAMFQGSNLNDLTLYKFNDDIEVNNFKAQIDAFVTAGSQFYIALATKKGIHGDMQLSLSHKPVTSQAQANNYIEDAIELASDNISFTMTHASDTQSSGAYFVRGKSTEASSRWWKWQAPATGGFVMDSSDSDFTPVVEVYLGDSPENIVLLNKNSADKLTFNATEDQFYFFRVSSSFEQQGSVDITLTKLTEAVTVDRSLNGVFTEVPSRITAAGRYSWQHQAEKDAQITINVSIADPESSYSPNIEFYEVFEGISTRVEGVSTTTQLEQDGQSIESTQIVYDVKEGMTYEVIVDSNAAILGDSRLILAYQKAAVKQVEVNKLSNFVTALKSVVPLMADDVSNNVVDQRIAKDYLLLEIDELFGQTFDADNVDLSVTLNKFGEDLLSSRISVTDKVLGKVLLAIEVDPNNLSFESNEQHKELDAQVSDYAQFEFANSQTVAIQFPADAFDNFVDQTFVSVRQQSLQDYPETSAALSLQSSFYDIDMMLFDANNQAYDTNDSGVINQVVVRVPIDKAALLNWLGDDSLNDQQATVLLNEALVEGRLTIRRADTVQELVSSEMLDLVSGSYDATVNFADGYVEFKTDHFSAFALTSIEQSKETPQPDPEPQPTPEPEEPVVETPIDNGADSEASSRKKSSYNWFGCSYKPSSEAGFDPVFLLMLLFSFAYLLRRRKGLV